MKRMKFIFSIASVFISVMMVSPSFGGSRGHGKAHWGYEGEEGPAHWGDLSEKFIACKEGKSQSPIDISNTVKTSLKEIEFHYKKSPLRVINNGHSIQVNYEKGSYVKINGKKYNLLQFHFHSPSEHTVNGKAYPMEAHFVHKSDEGKIAVIGIFMQKGKKNDLIQSIWDYIPHKVGKEKSVKGVWISGKDLLPSKRAYYKYSGSFTTPPCTEGVDWNVMVNPVEVSQEQIKKFQSFYKMNARPVQPLHGRKIKESL